MGRIYRLRKSPACPSRSASRRSPVPELKHEGCLDAPAAGPKSPTPSLTARRSGRSYRPYIYAATFALLGLSVGKFISLTLIPPALPAPHSPADEMLLSRLNAALEALPITRSLRSQPDVWQEWEAYSSLAPGDKVHRLGPGPMGGSRGLAVQRIFWNEAERKAISILFFGGGLSGWPGVTHGGATAIVMDESLGRVAVRILPAKTGVTANLHLDYRSPVQANNFYVLRAEPVEAEITDRKARVKGVLETSDGRVCLEGSALVVLPKGFKLGKIDEGF